MSTSDADEGAGATARVDPELCQGHNRCVSIAPDLFDVDDHGTASVRFPGALEGEQLARARARRRVVILLSDCRSTDDDDTVETARSLPELVILAPADDHEQAAHLGNLSGARWGTIAHPLDAGAALDRLLEARGTPGFSPPSPDA